MNLTQRMVDIVNQLYALHVDLANGDDEARRALTRMMCQQYCFEFGSLWGAKKAGSGNPQSKDSIANKIDETHFDSWDWQNGSTRLPQLTVGMPPMFPNLGPPQEFIPVSPINHLGATPIPPSDECSTKAQVAELRARVEDIAASMYYVNLKLDQILAKL